MRFAFDDDAPVPLTVIVIAACLCAALALFLRGGVIHLLVAMGFAALLAPFFLGFLGRWTWLRFHSASSREQRENARAACVITAMFIASSLVSLVPGCAVERVVEHCTMNWATQTLVPKIESYRADRGAYPATLEQVLESSSGSFFLPVEDLHYDREAEGDAFVLNLWTGMFSGWVWTSRGRTWLHYDD